MAESPKPEYRLPLMTSDISLFPWGFFCTGDSGEEAKLILPVLQRELQHGLYSYVSGALPTLYLPDDQANLGEDGMPYIS